MPKPTYGLKVVLVPDIKKTGNKISWDESLSDESGQVRAIKRALRNSALSGEKTTEVPILDNSFLTRIQNELPHSGGYQPTVNIQATSKIICSNCQAEYIIVKKPRRIFLLTSTITCPFCGNKSIYK